jgi:acyl carrier protein
MERQELISKLLKEMYGITNDISAETNLIDEFGFESIAFVELAAALGKETGVDIALSHAAKWTTVQSILGTISAAEEAAAAN